MSLKIKIIADEVSFCRVLKRIKGFNFAFDSSVSAMIKRQGCIFTDEGAAVAS